MGLGNKLALSIIHRVHSAGALCSFCMKWEYYPGDESEVAKLTDTQGRYTALASRRVRAPEFPKDVEWIGTARPLSVSDLRGRVVLLDFWTFCCINCMHVIPELHRLEGRFGERLQVIGVHSAKFTHEQSADSIRLAMNRYGITHPVAVDSDFRIWRQYGVRAWPTLVLIDPEGCVFFAVSGEGHAQELESIIADTLQHFGISGPVSGANELRESLPPRGRFSYPTKVAVDPSTGNIAVAENGANRVLILTPGGLVLHEIGNDAGMNDGPFKTACFRAPQGLDFDSEACYVADTGNHVIRRLDLAREEVTTVAGDGRGRYSPGSGGKALEVSLNSPWDLVWAQGRLFIAMAGNHQVWEYRPDTDRIRPFAGNGRESLRDGELNTAEFAQPSGITWDGGQTLYVADAESSSVRQIDLAAGKVSTLVGRGLFDFGQHLGLFERTELQHPLGVAWNSVKETLIVADSYNDRLVELDVRSRQASMLVDGFNEPGGIAYGGGVLWVADTNSGRLLKVDDDGLRELEPGSAPIGLPTECQGDVCVPTPPP